MIAQQRSQLCGEDRDVPAPLELVDIFRPFEAEAAEADSAIIDAVAVEMDHMIGLILSWRVSSSLSAA